jgi:single-strand DNA-binding protein
MLNKIIIQGRLTKDVELRRTGTGTPVASFTLAVDRDFGDKETDFIECVAWKNTAEFMDKYFSKGRMAVVVGRLQIRGWTDKDGNKRKTAEVVAENVYFGDSKNDTAPASVPAYASAPAPAQNYAMLTDDDALLPF